MDQSEGVKHSEEWTRTTLKYTSGYMEDQRLSPKLPDQIVYGLKLG